MAADLSSDEEFGRRRVGPLLTKCSRPGTAFFKRETHELSAALPASEIDPGQSGGGKPGVCIMPDERLVL